MILKQANRRILQPGTPRTLLSVATDAADTTLDVLSIEGFATNTNHLLIGEFGDGNSEIVGFTSATGKVITCDALVNDHPASTPVYLIKADQVEFFYSADNTTFASLAKVNIDPTQEFTYYEDVTNSTGYGKAIFYNTDATATYGAYWETVNYAGDGSNQYKFTRRTRGFVKQAALDQMGVSSDGSIPEEVLDRQITVCDDRIRNERWNWAIETGQLTVDTEAGITKYDLSTYLKKLNNIEHLRSVRLGTKDVIPVSRNVFYRYLDGAVSTTVATNFLTTDVTITLTDSTNFADEGTVLIEDDVITYTANNRTTNVLSGVTGITADHNTTTTGGHATEVWQNYTTGIPNVCTIIDGELQFYPLITNESYLKTLEIDYTKTFTVIDSDSDELMFPSHLYIAFLKWIIAGRKGEKDKNDYLQEFAVELRKEVIKATDPMETAFVPRVALYNRSRRQRLTD